MRTLPLFLREKPVRSFLNIDKNYVYKNVKDNNYLVSHSYLQKLKKIWLQNNLLETDKEGRINVINLTEKGKEVKRRLKEIVKILEMPNNPNNPEGGV